MTLKELICQVIAENLQLPGLRAEVRNGAANQADFAVMLTGGRCVIVEIELRREDPVNNVAKAWRAATRDPGNQGFIFIHVFSGFYRNSKEAKRDNAAFIG